MLVLVHPLGFHGEPEVLQAETVADQLAAERLHHIEGVAAKVDVAGDNVTVNGVARDVGVIKAQLTTPLQVRGLGDRDETSL